MCSGISGAADNRYYDLYAPTINAMTAAFLALLAATCALLVLTDGARRSLTAAPTTAPKIIDISATPPSLTPPSAPAAALSAPRTKGACTYTVSKPGNTLHR